MGTPCDIVDSVLKEAEGAKDLADFAARIAKKYGGRVPEEVMQELFTKAVQRYRNDFRQLDPIKEEMAKIVTREAWKNRTIGQKALHGAYELSAGTRALVTSADLSAPGRQGLFLIAANPRMGLKGIPDMVRAFASEKVSREAEAEILTRPNAPLYEKSKLYIADVDNPDLLKREEQFMSRWAENIPGWGKVVRGSERAYTTFLNRLRADNFDYMMSKLPNATEAEAQGVANFINAATGRGDLGNMGNSASELLSTVLFSPRFAASRMQLLAGQPIAKAGSGRASKLVAQTYLQAGAGALAVLSLAKAGGAEVETDSRSTDFGKIKVGNTRYDTLAGLQQYWVFLNRMGRGEKKTQSGAIRPLNGQPIEEGSPFQNDTRLDLFLDFARSKMAPLPSSGANLLEGKNVIGQPTNLGNEAFRNVVPMSWPDVFEAGKAEGLPKATSVLLMNLIGFGANYQQPYQRSGGGGKIDFTPPNPGERVQRQMKKYMPKGL